MSRFIFSILILTGSIAFAEDKTCTVKGMHCKGCTEMVEGKLCDETKYSRCEVKVTNAKKELGMVHLVTKDEKAKVDEASVKAVIVDAGYKVTSCKAKATKKG